MVEDEPLIRMAYAEYLADCGYLPLEVSSGDAAVEVLEKSMAIDIVLSDVRMPGKVDGFGVARWIAEHRPHLPIILISGDARARIDDPQIAHVPVLRKPVEMQVIHQKIKNALSKTLKLAV